MEVAAEGASAFTDTFLSNLSLRVRHEADLLLDQVDERSRAIRNRLVTGVYFALVLGVASAFIVVATLLYLVQSGLSWATAFLIGGIVLAIVAFVFLYSRR